MRKRQFYMSKRQLTVPETAARLGISEKTVWSWVYARRLPVTRFGRCVRIPEDSLEKMIEAATIPAKPAA